MSTLALIPARSGSRGIPGKNFRPLPDGYSCLSRAIGVCNALSLDFVISSDLGWAKAGDFHGWDRGHWLHRPDALASDTASMIDVVKHALSVVPGPPEQVIVLLQPTAALRTPAHVRAAIDLLESSGADSVVSVVQLPLTHHPDMQVFLADDGDAVRPRLWNLLDWAYAPKARQEMAAKPTYLRDGTVYAFRRSTLDTHGTMYGRDVRPLIIPASESCELDTPEDWERLEQRIRATMTTGPTCTCLIPTPHTRPSGRVICVNDSCGGLITEKKEPVARP